MIGYKNLSFWDNQRKKISPVTANFSASNQLILVFPELFWNVQKLERNHVVGNDHTNNFKDLTGFLNIWFFNDFLWKDSVWSSRSANPIDSFHPSGVALKNSSKVQNQEVWKMTLKLEKHEFEMCYYRNWFINT